jgi:hypothetical protein
VFFACVHAPLPPVLVEQTSRTVRFSEEVEPILNARCVTCHSCYNAGCQLKLSSFEGLDRGGSKQSVYSSSRLTPDPPTRLFMDANSTEEWRSKGFHSVTKSLAPAPYNDSVMLHFLDAKRRQPLPDGDYFAEADDLTCAANPVETSRYLETHPGNGMPFGLPALEDAEYETLAIWLEQGAKGPSEADLAARKTPAKANATEIEKWERFLNQGDAKHAMTARYLYEHFFLAHINFPGGDPSEFFEVVRSTTPPGQPIEVIATVRPYDDPGVERFFYRVRKIHSTIVYKTHMVVEWSDETLARYRELFIDPEWLEPPHEELLDTKHGANPFVIYAQIPPRARYQFLLDHSEYIIRTFIRGPVCKGQVALNVIHDHFWVMFIDPEADLTLKDPDFLLRQSSNLRLPTEQGSDERVTKIFSDAYRERYAHFYLAKSKLYDAAEPDGMSLDAIWKGERPTDAPVLTVYRHFDSASVHKGVLGNLPRTLWVIDYSHLERIYYALVAGFDVYGNVSHQVNVRRYMDYLRMEGELNFVQFMPPTARLPMLQSWYLGDKAFENVRHEDVLTERGTQVTYLTDDPKRELMERVVKDHILPSADIEFDAINYHGGRDPVPMPTKFETHEDILDGFRALTAPGTAFIKHHTQYGVNLLYVRVRDYQGSDRNFTMVINRWHDNVNSLFGEKDTLDPSKDTMDFLPGSIGSYPNYFFDVAAEDVPDFFDMLENFDGSDAYVAKVFKYGINRSEPDFWEVFDWFQARLDAADPLRTGLYDLNRYLHKARPGT